MGLNKEQLQAVNSTSDRILCLAGAGSGKTSTMIERISHLVATGVDPISILALTFTNNAAAEMKSRYERKHPDELIPEFRTFHAFCYSLICKDSAIRSALGYTTVLKIASDEQIKSIEERAKTQCRITISKEKLSNRENLNREEERQVTLYDKAITRFMLMENIITFDMLNNKVSELFASNHPTTQKYKEQYKHIHVDECLTSDMWVRTDNGWYRIDRLYNDYINGKSLPLVKSYNVKTSEYEYKQIVGALKSDNREVFEVHTEGLNKIMCTSNHKIYTQRGYVEVEDLIIGKDMVILDSPDKQKTKYLLNPDQYQICLGSYLGDGHLGRQSKFFTYRLHFTQGIKQKDYFLSKIAAFNLSYHSGISGYTQEESILSSNPTPTFALKDDIFNCVISDISPLGLAIWYQDDGTLSCNRDLRICTGSFTLEQTQKLSDMLNTRFGIETTPFVDTRGYSNIRFNRKNRDKFLNLIAPYMHPSMQYKTTIDISKNVTNYNSNYLNIGANFIDKITYIGIDTVYDLTVADNHNFIVSKHAHRTDSRTGTIVHNCQDTDRIQMNFLNSFPNTNFYFCGDTLQNLYSFRGTSNEYIKALANSDGWEKIRLFTNYRSTNQICEYANKFSAKYADPSYRIEMKGTRDGDKVHKRLIDKPIGYAPINPKSLDDVTRELSKLTGTSAILCRTNKEVSAVASYLKEHNIEFTTGKSNKIPNLIECAISDTFMLGLFASYLPNAKYGEYIRLSAQTKNPDINWFLNLYGNNTQIQEELPIIIALREIANSKKFTNIKLQKVSELLHIKNIKETDQYYIGKDFLDYLKGAIVTGSNTELYVGTIHSVKGLEYDNVFVMNVGSYNFRLNCEDEKNLFYVAITRAKNKLFVYELFDS